MFTRIFLLTLFLSFIGCGGSGSSSTESPNVPPVTDTKPELPEIPLENKVEEIATFIQLANQVRYFHPSDGAGDTLWDKFTSYGIYRVASTNGNSEYVATLRALFGTIAPNLKINGVETATVPTPSNGDTVKMWSQNGYVEAKYANNSVYHQKVVTDTYENLYSLGYIKAVNYNQTLPLSINIELPLVLTVVDGATVPQSARLMQGYDDYNIDIRFSNVYARLAAAGQLWAVLQHFYPYLDELNLTWSHELSPLINDCISSVNNCEMAMRRLLTKTGDNHNVLAKTNSVLGSYAPDLGFAWLNDHALLVHKGADFNNMSVGDQLIAINGIDIETLIVEQSEYSLRADNRKVEMLIDYGLLRGNENEAIELTLKNDNGDEYAVSTTRTKKAWEVRKSVSDTISATNTNLIQELDDKIYYVNVSALEGGDVSGIVNQLSDAHAILLDLRNYPNWQGWTNFLPHFTTTSMRSLPFYKPSYSIPNQQQKSEIENVQRFTSIPPYFDVPVIALASRYSISQNEHALGYVQNLNIPILGEPTYGINGDITYLTLLGGHENGGATIVFTGTKFTQNDGTLLRGMGIKPDIEVPVTIESIKQGKDIQLEAAIDYLKQRLD